MPPYPPGCPGGRGGVLHTKYTCDVKLEAEGKEERVDVEKLLYTQPSIKKAFQRGSPWRTLEDLIRALENEDVNPLYHPNLKLEVVRKGGRYFSNDNRRLYCLKRFQANHVERKVQVSCKVWYWAPAFDRHIERLSERQRAGLDDDYIKVRG